jgi:hypothetical protein
MADIVRGVTDPRETAAAQQMKGQFATMRLGDKQAPVQRIARDMAVLGAELIAEKFSPRTLTLVAALEEEDKPLADQAIRLLRTEGLRQVKLDIETDSTIAITETLQKEAWTEYVATVGSQVPSFVQFIAAVPEAAQFFGQLLAQGSKLFRFGRSVDAALDQMVSGLTEKAMTPPQPPPPDPVQMAKTQNEQQSLVIDEKKLEVEMVKVQQRAQEARAKLQMGVEVDSVNIRLEAEKMRQQQDMQRSKQAHEMDLAKMDSMSKFYERQGKDRRK